MKRTFKQGHSAGTDHPRSCDAALQNVLTETAIANCGHGFTSASSSRATSNILFLPHNVYVLTNRSAGYSVRIKPKQCGMVSITFCGNSANYVDPFVTEFRIYEVEDTDIREGRGTHMRRLGRAINTT